jgi:hypothetical protein
MIDGSVKDFVTYDYSEAKDLAKSFLILISAILVFSITFSEKVVSFQNADLVRRRWLVVSWLGFVVAIILCGTSILFYFNMLVFATCDGRPWCTMPDKNSGYEINFFIGNWLMFAAGVSFTIGLVSLVISALLSLWATPQVVPSGSDDEALQHLVLDTPDSGHGSVDMTG